MRRTILQHTPDGLKDRIESLERKVTDLCRDRGGQGGMYVESPTLPITGASAERIGPVDGTQTIDDATFQTLTLPTVNFNDGNLDTATGIYTVPDTGIYLTVARLRLADGEPHYSYGVGVHTSNVDGPWFLWTETVTTTNKRSAYQVTRVKEYQAGDQVRAYTYIDKGGTAIVNSSAFDIFLLGTTP